ncbi:hypothetical protein EJ05DRAFT_5971 [Pseudovirgaria hyperparasitica]|uniref:Secreted protein n=1 Tax=Pseudovirgaria hyperparasitica TaxID=470096 RepID=A0A6A6WJF7_9PEZI|nr:uncharacterized protein EJ05DRAFT_5971 [Pseudovirgaria hyperparasitica]KAF2762559.1 hypothetical protein EJ05DRAFT_5971 [Pseudovirgaria hyperparasitica]
MSSRFHNSLIQFLGLFSFCCFPSYPSSYPSFVDNNQKSVYYYCLLTHLTRTCDAYVYMLLPVAVRACVRGIIRLLLLLLPPACSYCSYYSCCYSPGQGCQYDVSQLGRRRQVLQLDTRAG